VTKTTTLKTFNADMARRRALAAALGTSPDYLWQLGVRFSGKRPSTDLAKAIEHHSALIWRQVPKQTLRPDVWGDDTPVSDS
jgi:hypothetical protein